jgi:glycosyltransferase involved in cell wall biosynthesis
MKNLKIALCKTTFAGPVSGADEILLNYAITLRQSGYDVTVVLLYPPSEQDQYLRRLKLAGVTVSVIVTHSYLFASLRAARHALSSALFFLFFLKGPPNKLRTIWQIALGFISQLHYRHCRRYFADQRPDLLHVFTPDTGAALIIRAGSELGIPVLYHEMGTARHLPMLNDYYHRLESVLPLCTEVAALSPRLAAEWLQRFPFLGSVSVLPLIMELYPTLNIGAAGASDRTEIVFGFAARLEEGKGPLVLLDALAEVNREERLAITRIAGVGPQVFEAKARAHNLGMREACEFVGHYSEPLGRAAFMNSLDVFVLPSLAEGTPNGIIEAMAHGIPVIATKVGGIPDIIDVESGILIPPGDASALADAMHQLIRDPKRRKSMGEAAKRRYQELFSPPAVLPLMLQTYGRLTRNGHEFAEVLSAQAGPHPWAGFPPVKQTTQPET